MKTLITNNALIKTLSVTLLLSIGISAYANDTFHCPLPHEYKVIKQEGQYNIFMDDNRMLWETIWPQDQDGYVNFDNTPFVSAHTNMYPGTGVTCEIQFANELNYFVQPYNSDDQNATAYSNNFTPDSSDLWGNDEICTDGYEDCVFTPNHQPQQ